MKRTAKQHRKTKETDISIFLDLDTDKESKIITPIPFFTHMLEIFARHSGFHMECDVKGDVDVDFHHTVEDTGIVLGGVIKEALGDKRGINRYGHIYIPMDEALARVVLDLSGRTFYHCQLGPSSGRIGTFDLDNCKHFFRSFADNLQLNLHVELLYGEDRHHIIEAVFKGVARSLRHAVQVTGTRIPSTKEKL